MAMKSNNGDTILETLNFLMKISNFLFMIQWEVTYVLQKKPIITPVIYHSCLVSEISAFGR